MSKDDLPDPTCLPDAPHPRDTAQIYGHDAAQALFLDAFNSGRLHHGWMITGPKGIGKATLAWRMARFLLATPMDGGDSLFGAPPAPASLDIDPEHPVARRMAAGSQAGLYVLKRTANDRGDRISADIRIDDVRRMKGFFALSVPDGGRRVVIVDAADDMNTSAANAILKVLEEPPENTTILMVTHQPSALLPTIRSRCRVLRCAALTQPDMAQALAQADVHPAHPDALAALSGGSVGAAVQLETQDGVALYAALVAVFAGMPKVDRQVVLKLADTVNARNLDRLALLLDLFDLFLARLARTGVAGPPAPQAAPGEAEVMARLCPNLQAARKWAALAQTLVERARQGAAVNLDPSTLILDMVLKIEAEARA